MPSKWLGPIFCTLYHLVLSADNMGKAALRLERFEQCPDKLEMPNIFHDMVINQIGYNKVRLFGSIRVNQDIVNPASLKVTLHKCASKEEPSTCEYYYTYTSDQFCQMVGAKNMPWSDFWLQTTLPTACPVKKGNYSINGATFNVDKMPSVPILYGYWKARSTGKSGGKAWHCAISEFSLGPRDQPSRRRGKKN